MKTSPINQWIDHESYFAEINQTFDESRYDSGPWRGDVAHAFQQYRPPLPESIAQCLIRELLLHPEDIMIDLGCGTGHFSRLLAHQGLQVIGADINRDMLAQALSVAQEGNNGGTIRYVLAGAEELKAFPCSVRAVTICRAFFAMDKVQTLSALNQIVADGGTVAIIEEPNFLNGMSHGRN